MIDRTSAKAMMRYMDENFGRDPELAIVDGEPSETTHAWVFFYNTRRYLEGGEFSEALNREKLAGERGEAPQ